MIVCMYVHVCVYCVVHLFLFLIHATGDGENLCGVFTPRALVLLLAAGASAAAA
jgi:hypothetical protein